MASRRAHHGRVNDRQAGEIYANAYKLAYNWEEMLPAILHDHLSVFSRAFNCPVTMSVSALLGLTAAVCGPKVKVHNDYDMALNMYVMGVGAPGSGKSVAFGKLISDSTDLIYQDYGVQVLVESYSCAGLHKHHQDNQNYCLVSSDEGGRILTTISAKESRNEPERALLNKLWTGKGDVVALKDGTRGFGMTSFSMAVFIQHQPLLNDLMTLSGDVDGFLDRFVIMVDKPAWSMKRVKREAIQELKSVYGDDFIPRVIKNVYEIHSDGEFVYSFTKPAQAYLDRIEDELAQEFNAQYQSGK